MTAYTFLALRLLPNTVPLLPSASERDSGMPSAQTSTLKPAGSLSLLTGRSFAGRPVMCGANGCSVDSAIAGGLPCCQEGGGAAAGLSCARALAEKARATAMPMDLFMILSLLCGDGMLLLASDS